jgi:hypothetical protein
MFRNIGVPIFIIFQIFRKVFWVIVIIGGMVFAFAHILHILLRDDPTSDDFNKYNTSLISVYLFLVRFFFFFDLINLIKLNFDLIKFFYFLLI